MSISCTSIPELPQDAACWHFPPTPKHKDLVASCFPQTLLLSGCRGLCTSLTPSMCNPC